MIRQDFKFSLHLKSNPYDETKGIIHVDCGGYISDQSLVDLFQHALETIKAIFSKSDLGEVGFAMVLNDFARIENKKNADVFKEYIENIVKAPSADESSEQ